MGNKYIVKESDFTLLSNALRTKAEISSKLAFPSDFISVVNNFEGGASSLPFGDKLYSFGVMADIHIEVAGYDSSLDKFNAALSMFESLGAETVCISGDVADTSNTDELIRYRDAVVAHPNLQIHTCAGNHDKRVIDEVWETYVGTERNYVFTKNNDVFIFLSVDNGSSSKYTQAIEWLKNQLLMYKGARIFLFMHFPPSGYSGLLEGQYYGFDSSEEEDNTLVKMFNNTRHITVFHGHTHYSFDVQEYFDEMNIFRFNAKDVNLIHVPSSAYTRDKNFNSNGKSEGWLVDVYEKGIVLTGCDFETQTLLDIEYSLTTDRADKLNSNAIVVENTELLLAAGETAEVEVSLLQPANTAVNIAANNSFVSVSPATLNFTTSNYNVPQTVTFSVVAEGISETTNTLITYSSEGSANQTTSITISSSQPIIAADDTWYKSTTPRPSITSISLVDSASAVPSTYSESWDASAAGDRTVTVYINGTDLYIAGNGTGEIKASSTMESMFSDAADVDYFSSVTAINGLNLLNTTGVTSIRNMFNGCASLTSLNLNNFDTSAVENMNGVFQGCSGLTSLEINDWDVSGMHYAYYLFANCSSLTTINLSKWNTSSMTECSNMFSGCSSLTSVIANFDCSRVNYAEFLFADCSSLTSFDFSILKDFAPKYIKYFFYNCLALTNINFTNFDTSNVIDTKNMFKHCEALTTLDLSSFNTSNVTNMAAMFNDCINLTSINVSSFDTSKVTNMSEMFDHCDSLTTLNISNFDTSSITNNAEGDGLYRFARKSAITDLTVGPNFIQASNLPDAAANKLFVHVSEVSTPLTITGANDVFKTYDFVSDNRTVTFTN